MYKKFRYRFLSVLLVVTLISSFFIGFVQAATDKASDDDTGFKISLNWNDSSDPNIFVCDSEKSEKKMVRLRVYYESKKVGKNYNPGEIAITVPGLKDAVRSGGNPQAAVAADKASSKNKGYDWSYTYSLTSNTYTFTNNETVNENTTFQGSFEIIWQMDSRSSRHGYTQNFQAKLRTAYNDEAISNTVSYEQTRKRDEFKISQKAEALYPYQIPIFNLTDEDYKDYVWMKYVISTDQQKYARDVQSGKRKYKLYFLKGTVVDGLTKTGEIKTIDGNDYECYETDIINGNTNSINDVIVAYKRSDFKDYPEIKNYVELCGQYYEEDSEVLIDECDGSYSLSNFELLEWMYGNTPYNVSKTMYGENNQYIRSIDDYCFQYGAVRGNNIDTGKNNYLTEMNFTLIGATANNKYDVELLDEEMQIQTKNGLYRRLRDDEYNFTSVSVPSYYCVENNNKVSSEIPRDNKYRFALFIRQSGNDEFNSEPFEQGFLTSKRQNISVPNDTVGIKIMYYGIDENFINIGIDKVIDDVSKISKIINLINSGNLEYLADDFFIKSGVLATFVFHTPDDDIMTENGQVVNFLRNSVYSYNSDSDGQGYHLHGYFDRTAELHIHEIPNIFSVENRIDRDTYSDDDDSRYFNFNGSITAKTDLADGNDLSAFSLYTIVPEGLQLNARYNTPDKLIDRLSFSGTGLNSGYIKNHATLEIIKNYKDSGRTYIAIHFDFSDAPIKTSSITVGNIPMCGTWDSLSELTQNWTMRAAMIIDQKGIWYSSSTDSSSFEEGIWNDIDGDENTSETASFSSNISEKIWNPGHSNLELTKLVKTELLDTYTYASKDEYDEYIDSTISKTYINSEYSYKIRASIGEGSAKNIVIVDNLEEGPKHEWQGDFVEIKTNSGNPTIYYSSEIITDKPDFVNDTRWTTDKSTLDKVRSVAVDYGDFELKSGKNIYIEIIMKSPAELGDFEDKITENNSRIYYDSYDDQGEFIESVYLPSNDVPVKLTAFMGDIRILKTDQTSGLGLEGAKFDLYRQDGDTPNPSTDTVIKSNLTTDSSGTAKITDLKCGNYYLIETSAPKGYKEPSDEPIMAILQDRKLDKALIINVPNQRKEGQVTVIKTSDRNSSARIEGAEFAVYKSDGTLVKEGLTTDSDGVLKISGLEWGDYYLVETKAPKGYIKSEQNYDFTVFDENDAGQELTLKVENKQIPASVVLTKYEALENGTKNPANVPIDNAGYELYDSDDNLLGTYMTDEKGKIYVEDLTFGTYYFKETIAAKGYEKYPDKIYFTVDGNHTDAALEVETTDTRLTGQVWMQKFDDIGQYVSGAKYALFRKSDDVQVDVTGQPSNITFTTNAEGIFEDGTYVQKGVIQGLYWGEYYLKEVESPTGYELNDKKYYITVNRDNVNDIIIIDNVVDNRQRGKVVLTKVAEDDETQKLQGAEFTLYRSDGSVYRDNLQPSDANGEIEVTDIEWGSYYFLEKTAPQGYGLNPDKIRFSVNYLTANKTQYLTVTDPAKECDLTVTKRIDNNEVWFAHGNPTFTFRVEGTDIEGNDCTFYRAVTFNENSTADENGYLSQSVVFSGLKAGTYTVSEVGTIRYTDTEWDSIEGELVSATEPTYNLDSDKPAHVRFTNRKTIQLATSHTAQVTNIIKVQSKITAISAVWSGPKSVSGTSITDEMLEQYLDVYKIYDDGSKEEITFGGYVVTYSEFEEGQSGEYTVYVSYTDGRTYRDSFDLYFNLPPVFTTELLSSKPFTDTDGTSYDGTVAVTGYTGDSTVLKISESVIGLNELTDIGDNQSTGTVQYTDNNKRYKVVSIKLKSKVYNRSIYGVQNIKNLIVSDGVETIDDYAFYNCSGLTSVTLGNSVTSIGNYAFYNCTGLTGELIIPDSVTTIGKYAFYNCSGLTSVTLGNSVTSIGESAFSGCKGLTGELTIPDRVTTIGRSAFRHCTYLTSLTLGNNVTTIDDEAFYSCKGLTGKLTIPNSVKTIGGYAFQECTGLTSVTLGNSVTTIGNQAFYSCTGLTGELTIPESVTTIGNSAFNRCTSLENINVDENNSNYSSHNGVLFNKSKTELIACPAGKTGAYTIPEGVTKIWNYAFNECTGLTGTLTIPDSVTTIGIQAFFKCTGLTGTLTIPDSVESIGQSAFNMCSGLTSVIIGNSVTSIGNYAFNNCSGLTGELTIPDSVTSIGERAFFNCSGLTSLTLGNSVKTIGNYAFSGCKGLTGELKIPDSVTTIGSQAFYQCSKLTGELRIPDSVTTINSDTFNGCSGLTSLTLSNNLTTIGGAAFNGCSGLTGELIIPDSVTTIGSSAFNNCKGLTSLTLGNSVKTIGNYAFNNCSGLTGELTIPDGVTTINTSAFYNCTGLTSLTVPDSVTSIGSNAFYNVPKVIYNGTASGSPWGAKSVVTS